MADQSPPDSSGFPDARLYVWVKSLEGKVNNLLREVTVLKNDLIRKNNDLKKEVTNLSEDLINTKHEQEMTLQKMDLIIKELKKTAGIEEVMTLRKYIDFWNPMNFVTRQDLDRVIEAKLQEREATKITTMTQEIR